MLNRLSFKASFLVRHFLLSLHHDRLLFCVFVCHGSSNCKPNTSLSESYAVVAPFTLLPIHFLVALSYMEVQLHGKCKSGKKKEMENPRRLIIQLYSKSKHVERKRMLRP